MSQIDIGAEWKELFDNVNNSSNQSTLPSDEAIIYKYLSINQQLGKNYVRDSLQRKLQEAYEQKSLINRKLQITYDEKYERGIRIKELNALTKKLEREKNDILSSTTFKVGKIIMYFPVLIKNSLKSVFKKR